MAKVSGGLAYCAIWIEFIRQLRLQRLQIGLPIDQINLPTALHQTNLPCSLPKALPKATENRLPGGEVRALHGQFQLDQSAAREAAAAHLLDRVLRCGQLQAALQGEPDQLGEQVL